MQRTVLVVDDDRLLCNLLTELLTEAGYTVQCADDGEACGQIQRSSPDVVLSDIKMPRLGGIDLRVATGIGWLHDTHHPDERRAP